MIGGKVFCWAAKDAFPRKSLFFFPFPYSTGYFNLVILKFKESVGYVTLFNFTIWRSWYKFGIFIKDLITNSFYISRRHGSIIKLLTNLWNYLLITDHMYANY
jgi:hypothetical protein